MSKQFDQKLYEKLLQTAKEDNIHLLHTFDRKFHKGGFTIAWQRAGEGKNCRMLNVSVSYCSLDDYFSRKIGALQALRKAYSGMFIQVPLNSPDSAEIVQDLRRMFDCYKLFYKF